MPTTITERIDGAQDDLVRWAKNYALSRDPEDWRELCRAKATLDALSRVAR